ncbi:Chromatin assembly factor 1 complex p150 subunit N-terminal [Aspergillus parasiticus SU-1]|uniref:Chromatin assembly factor 1 complex p150 subunit N-terminal n=1 Tax=Aspergillus parasiticus (strain ATCC 56775 / NRRL 5862 / SRRC 143 / SU-1) TaxID=1403190 RepID=A0A0F0IFI5_ASPPU|nr:Chromatin assembly factor 1 complex p150 subunit N-terminal [Aspergillus parasiticus SU-1]
MIDENLPTFFLKKTQQKFVWTILHSHRGTEPEPAYTLRHPDPTSPSSKNRYAAALVDPYVPDIVYGEVLLIPEWTQPSLSAEAIRQNGGVTPSPEPILPTRFTVHLYNPDQQVIVHYKPKTWNSPATWSFEMPQQSFRQPSSSTLDRTQTDPAAADTTPKLRFSWRKDSKLSKDLTCLLSGKTTALSGTKTKSKEPDITISIFQALRELTLYEPNLYRVEMEDFKGLEVVLLLGAITIRDVYFTTMRDAFKLDATSVPVGPSPAAVANSPNGHTTAPAAGKDKQPVSAGSGALNANTTPTIPEEPTVENPPRRKQEQDKEEERRTKKLLEEEEKARRKRQAEIDKETRRLQRLYGEEEQKVRHSTPSLPPRPLQSPPPSERPAAAGRGAPAQRYYHTHHHSPSVPHIGHSPYLQAPGGNPHRQSVAFLPTQPQPQPAAGSKPQKLQQKKSFFGFRRSSSDENKLAKKRSSMF